MPLLNWAKHKQIMVRILKDIYQDPVLGSALGFKGGTAAMLFYDLPRRSVDLDFDILTDEKHDDIAARVATVIGRYGTIKNQYVKRNTVFALLSYGDDDANIKIEINRRGAQGRYDVQNYLGVSLLVMHKEDMFANKLIALTHRAHSTARDIFDVWYFARNMWSINERIIEEKTGKSLATYIGDVIAFLEGLPPQQLLAGLGELIDANQKAWIKKSLISDTVFLLRSYQSLS